jgi:large subunit ribosomal protein L29
MRPAEFRNMTDEELEYKGAQLREELFNLKVRKALGQLENPLKIPALRRDIARVETILREHKTKN